MTNTAWQIAASYVLTGEKASYNGVDPRHGVDLKGRARGKVAFRLREQFRADPNAFALFADPTKSAAKGIVVDGWQRELVLVTSKVKMGGRLREHPFRKRKRRRRRQTARASKRC